MFEFQEEYKLPLEKLESKYPISYDDLEISKNMLKLDLTRPKQMLVLDLLCQASIRDDASIISLAESCVDASFDFRNR